MKTWESSNPEWCDELTVDDEGFVTYQQWLYCDKSYQPWIQYKLTWEEYLAKGPDNPGSQTNHQQSMEYVKQLLTERDGKQASADW